MKKIILASKSRARQELLRKIGLRFAVVESKSRETRRVISTYQNLVIRNARRKAEEVAGRYTEGVVIAADTVVVVGKKIIGKPRNIKDACKTLQILSRKPQWVYTGVAVIDIKSGKTLTSYEKTKIHMRKMTDEDINDYFKKVSPLDKAGSFDIQGLGAIFIEKVEGCFYNVVGLPLSRLATMLKSVGVDILRK